MRVYNKTFSALLRAEIPKILRLPYIDEDEDLSVLFYEPKFPKYERSELEPLVLDSFSALLRAEIPKILRLNVNSHCHTLSVLFYEPKFPKSRFQLKRSTL